MNEMTTTVEQIPRITRSESRVLGATEYSRMFDVLNELSDDDWLRPTDCPAWNVRAVAGHVLGMAEGFASLREWIHQMRAGSAAAGDGPFIDGMTAVQVRERAALTREELVDRLAKVGPRAARWRARVPFPFRWMPMKEMVDGVEETWRLAYLLEVILTRDPWMHRVDIARATGRELVLTPEHDGRVVADVVAEWARRHGKPFVLVLEGPAGGSYTMGVGGEEIRIDAVEFCRVVSDRGTASGLLSQSVPF